jgi:uncharacterized protein
MNEMLPAPQPAEISDDDLFARFPDVRLDHENKHFYRGLLTRRLLLNRCEDCGRRHAPPRMVCPHCWSFAVTPSEVTGGGTIALLTFLHQGPSAPGVDYSTPYPLAAVDLESEPGLRFSSTIVGPLAFDAAIGDRVELVWIERNGNPYPAFNVVPAPMTKRKAESGT